MGEHEVKLAILDRDGTLIDVVRDEETGAIVVAFHPAQLKLLGRAVEGLQLLRDAGYRFAIATNQPGPAKGQISREAVARTNQALVELLATHGIAIEHVAVCMHHETGGAGGDPSLVKACGCRKPGPDLLVECMRTLGAKPEHTWMIGDSRGDVTAGERACVRTVMIFDTKRCELCPLRQGPTCAPTVQGANILAAAQSILAADRATHAS